MGLGMYCASEGPYKYTVPKCNRCVCMSEHLCVYVCVLAKMVMAAPDKNITLQRSAMGAKERKTSHVAGLSLVSWTPGKTK